MVLWSYFALAYQWTASSVTCFHHHHALYPLSPGTGANSPQAQPSESTITSSYAVLFLSGHRRPRVTVEVSMVTCILKHSLSEGSASLTILLTGALFLLGRKGRPRSLGFWPQQIAPPTHTRFTFFFFPFARHIWIQKANSLSKLQRLALCICQQDA